MMVKKSMGVVSLQCRYKCTQRGVQVIGGIDHVAFDAKALQVWVMAFNSGSFLSMQYRPTGFFLETCKSYAELIRCQCCVGNWVSETWFFCCCPLIILVTLGIKLSGALTILMIIISKSS
jgi:hypothetical protein